MFQVCHLLPAPCQGPTARRPFAAIVSLASLLLPAGLSGCSAINSYDDPAAVGDWQTRANTAGGRRSTMTAEIEGGGDATLWYVLTSEPDIPLQDSFTMQWEQVDDTEFELRMRCTSSTNVGGGCEGHDFTMRCDAGFSGDKLDCTGTSFWANFTFAWERE